MPETLTLARQERMTLLADRAARRASALWRKQMGPDFDRSWQEISPRITTLTAEAQVSVAAGASAYLAAVNAGGTVPDVSAVRPAAFAGVDGSGRTLEGLLYGSVTTAKELIGKGAGLAASLHGGDVYLQTMVHTAAYDTGRSSHLTAMSSHEITHYVRAISPGACGRCIALAGISVSSKPFDRHPRCRCTSQPVTEEVPDRFTDPSAYFERMTKAEQDKAFSVAGAEAIRAGADPVAVISARRGAQRAYTTADAGVKRLARLERSVIGRNADGSPILGYTTGEGTTRRGDFGKRNQLITGSTRKRVRLMPETIVALTDDVELRRVLLRDAGYLDVPVKREEMSGALGGGYAARRAEMLRDDRDVANAFYKRRGIELRG